jgi:hypothetical protein
MLNWLFKLIVVGGTVGSLVIGVSLYNSGFRTIEDIQKKYGELTQVTTELLTDAKINRPPTYDFDISDIKNKIELTSTLKVAELSSEQIINIHQTGTRDTWVIGGLLKGNAYFNFKASFNGSVEYNTKEITFAQKGKQIIVTLGVPKILLNEIKYVEVGTSGNLSDILAAKQTMLSVLDSTASNYNYKLYFTDPKTKPLMTDASTQASDSLKSMINGILKAAKPDVDYEIVINGAAVGIDTVTIKNGSGTATQVPLGDILNADTTAISNRLIGTNSSAKVNFQVTKNQTSIPK